MDLLMVVTTPESGQILAPLARACARSDLSWGVFFTGEGVKNLLDGEVGDAMLSSEQAVACQDSWNQYLSGQGCPVELGSQTSNSAMLSSAQKIVSL